MSTDNINILCATDDKYVPYCGVMLTSVFENNRDIEVCAYIIVDHPLSEINQRRFKKLSQMYNQKVEFLIVDNSFLKKFPVQGMDYWSTATFYRLYASELLPKTVDKVLYLDCDIIVTGSLRGLWRIELSGTAVGAVNDIFSYDLETCTRLQYPLKYSYFNAGVLLINLEYWRENHIGERCRNYLSVHNDRLLANDQDVLNAVLYDKKRQLPIIYNYQVQFLKRAFFEQYDEKFRADILSTTNPVIIHYAQPTKPWECLYYKMPFKRDWWYYNGISLWKRYLPMMPNRKWLNYMIKRYILWPFGIMWNQAYIEL